MKEFETLGRLLENVEGGEVVRIGILRDSTAAITQIRLRRPEVRHTGQTPTGQGDAEEDKQQEGVGI
jgi:hypothetical protein